jgi:hypothetical protein
MKTLGRTLIILTFAALIAAGLYALVTANASSLTPSGLPGDGPFPSGEGLAAFDGARPAFPEGFRPEGREMQGGWTFGLAKNLGVIAFLVTVIVLPKSLQKRKRIAKNGEENVTPSGL